MSLLVTLFIFHCRMSVVWIYWWLVWFDVNKHTGSYLHRQIYQHRLSTYVSNIHDKNEILFDDNTGMAMVTDMGCTTSYSDGEHIFQRDSKRPIRSTTLARSPICVPIFLGYTLVVLLFRLV